LGLLEAHIDFGIYFKLVHCIVAASSTGNSLEQ
jgi:hypothetical protein